MSVTETLLPESPLTEAPPLEPPAPEPAPRTTSREPYLTRFFILEGSDNGLTWKVVGEKLARDREHALKLYYGDPVTEQLCAAVSENAWKPVVRKPKVVNRTETTEFKMPSAAAQLP